MTATEIYQQEIAPMINRDKIRLVNMILAGIKDGRTNNDKKAPVIEETSPVMPVFEGLSVFSEMYKALKGVSYTTNRKYAPTDFKYMKHLLTKIAECTVESGVEICNNELLIANLRSLLEAVSTMKNQWYFENRFTPYGLSQDFEKIYTILLNNNSHATNKRAFDYL